MTPDGEGIHIPQLLCPVGSAWPIVRNRGVVGGLIFPSFQAPSLIGQL